ncbi:MAG: gliding motility-associated C-terminal domain-containing protein [Crocinitomicaceae bacterium]|nr:gliding motility-associated C-terminal domain-containing protein [Crocinitomicaceae bacterium]
MSTTNYFHAAIVFFLSAFAGFSQCLEDVVITNGATIEMCADAPVSITASNGFVSYAWTGPETLSGLSIVPQFSGDYTVAATDGVGCISFATITVTIHPTPTPTIVSSEGNPICPGGGTTLSTTSVYASYDWGAGNTNSTFFAPTIGAYSVTVVDNNGCAGNEVITISELSFDLTSVAQDGCYGGTVMLQASGGASYAWTTGESGSSIVVAPTASTNYGVTITSGSCVQTLNITVDPVEVLDYSLVDTIYLAPGESETLEGPPGFESYLWSPDSYINISNTASIIVTAGDSHILTMVATHSTGCIITENVVVIVVTLSAPNGFSPNADGINDIFIIPELSELDGSLLVWNRWGDLVLDESNYQNNWGGTCQTALCMGNKELPEGTYYYQIEVQDIIKKGFITLKR